MCTDSVSMGERENEREGGGTECEVIWFSHLLLANTSLLLPPQGISLRLSEKEAEKETTVYKNKLHIQRNHQGILLNE